MYCVIILFGYNGLDYVIDMDVDDVFLSFKFNILDGFKLIKVNISK